jgi:hypothetical protein
MAAPEYNVRGEQYFMPSALGYVFWSWESQEGSFTCLRCKAIKVTTSLTEHFYITAMTIETLAIVSDETN